MSRVGAKFKSVAPYPAPQCHRRAPSIPKWDARRLETAFVGPYHCLMFRFSRLSKLLVALVVAGVMYAGPVAACVCFTHTATEMPCCPDQPADHSHCAVPHAQVSACDPAPAHLISGSFDRSAPVAIAPIVLPLWSLVGSPRVPLPVHPPPNHPPPIYLATLRLRI
jgi:hypothetical protein